MDEWVDGVAVSQLNMCHIKAHVSDLKNCAKASRQFSHHLQQQKGYFLYFHSLFCNSREDYISLSVMLE